MKALRLIDGPLVNVREHTEAIVRRMAQDLVTYEAAPNEADAIRCLMARDYSPFHVLRHVDDARQLAFQEIVAREMGKP